MGDGIEQFKAEVVGALKQNTYITFFKFIIGQDVEIIDLKLPAKVMARCDRGGDIRDYRIIFWSEGKRCDEWVFEHEIRETK